MIQESSNSKDNKVKHMESTYEKLYQLKSETLAEQHKNKNTTCPPKNGLTPVGKSKGKAHFYPAGKMPLWNDEKLPTRTDPVTLPSGGSNATDDFGIWPS